MWDWVWGAGMEWEFKVAAQRDLDKRLKPFLTARRVSRPYGGWLRTVRKALGLTAAAMARDLKVSPSAIFQLERSEWKDTITLNKLHQTARAMGCQLVYCIVPQQSNFEGQAIEWVKRLFWMRKAARKKKRKSNGTRELKGRLIEELREKVREAMEQGDGDQGIGDQSLDPVPREFQQCAPVAPRVSP